LSKIGLFGPKQMGYFVLEKMSEIIQNGLLLISKMLESCKLEPYCKRRKTIGAELTMKYANWSQFVHNVYRTEPFCPSLVDKILIIEVSAGLQKPPA
jgi:hypothetical protein